MTTQTVPGCMRCRADCTPLANLSADEPAPDGSAASWDENIRVNNGLDEDGMQQTSFLP